MENEKGDLSVLITGGSGLIGRYLTSALLSQGYSVSHLSRNTGSSEKVKVFKWNPQENYIDPAALENVDYIVHLAGANIGEKRWSKSRKLEIVSSRIDTAKLLHSAVSNTGKTLKGFISASAIGYYGSVTSGKIYSESDSPAEDFLGNTCRLWEEAADMFANVAERIVKIRTAVVLEKSDSALSKLLKPAGMGVFPRLGNGRQYMPWIHISDLCGIYLKAINDEKVSGAYNAVAPQHISQTEFMKTMAIIIKKPFLNPPVPAFILRAFLGEMSDVVLKGSRISSMKIENSSYIFQYNNLKAALENAIYGKNI